MKKVALKDIATLITKGTTPTSLGFDFVDDGINFIKIESISENGTFLPEKFAHISLECDEKLKRSRIEENDILFSIAGAIGRVALVNNNILPANTNQALAIIRIPEGVVDYKYLIYMLKSPTIIEQLERKKQGVAQLNISLKDVGDILVTIPDIDTQKTFAYEMDKVTALISLRKKQLEKLDELVKSRFLELFGDPVTNTLGWEQVLLREVTSKIGSGATPRGGKESYQNEGVSLIRSMNVHDGRFEYKELAHITETQAAQLDNVIVEENDVFINITGASVARSCIVPTKVLPARVNQHVAIIRCINSQLNPIFANNMFLNERFKEKLLDIGESGGATRQAITKQQLETLVVVLPPLDQQTQFAAFVTQTDKSKFYARLCIDLLQNERMRIIP